MSKAKKKATLGAAFNNWLAFLEWTEHRVLNGKWKGNPTEVTMHKEMFRIDPEKRDGVLRDILIVSATLANLVRTSVKYKTNTATLKTISTGYDKELQSIAKTVPMYLPFDNCTIIMESNEEPDTCLLMCARRTEVAREEGYPEMHLKYGDDFVEVNYALSSKGVVNHIPAQTQFVEGTPFDDSQIMWGTSRGVEVLPFGTEGLQFFELSFFTWLHSFSLPDQLTVARPGVPPAIGINTKPHKPRKPREYPAYEHNIISIPVDHSYMPTGAGGSKDQPHKRLHRVRGHLRHYKSGKVSVVRPHWRGDAELGVLTHDIELVAEKEAQT